MIKVVTQLPGCSSNVYYINETAVEYMAEADKETTTLYFYSGRTLDVYAPATKLMEAMRCAACLPNAPDDRTPTTPSHTQGDRTVGVPVHHLVGQVLPEKDAQ